MTGINNKLFRYLLQAFNYLLFIGIIGYFATNPAIRVLADDEAVITIAFAHAGDLREPCTTLSGEELAALPANMRKPEKCPRERSPVIIETLLNGAPLYNSTLQPSGIFGDGGVDVYYNAKIPSGDHHLSIRMDDSVRVPGFNHTFEKTVKIAPAQILLVEFDSRQGFVIKETLN